MWVVVDDDDVVGGEGEQVGDICVELQFRERSCVPRQLLIHLIYMIAVDMRIAEGVYELAWLQSRDLRHQVCEQGIRSDIEGHPEKEIGTPLIQLTREPSIGNVELKDRVARRERHVFDLADIPGGDDQTAAVRVVADAIDDCGDLVMCAAIGAFPTPPLCSVDGSKIAAIIGPLVPDGYILLAQPPDVRIAAKKPQQFRNDRSQVHFLGRDQWETVGEVKSQLPAEDAQRACAGSVGSLRAAIADITQKVEVLTHCCSG